ncbi:MAG: multifunctional transcriptional regulator/nicotinamide-nucleotide adenylyltransferase/ribosylnicotinamide kinase NadR [Lactobacillales bacterium]|nr:multifunctional transcriptional regulator/nicotinamide-nucleotide adenylyltransferase/ribosylnicotinamide kinase NadR [Lactobacillales bacterium]
MKYKVGMYGGSFNPLHLGHVNNIITASNLCEKLYLVLSVTDDENEIDHRERFMWLKNITSEMDNVEVFEIFDKNTSKDTYDWETGANDIKKYINAPIDVVFSGDDYKGKNRWEQLYPESEIYYIPRENINISSTEIRENPYKYFEYLPNCVRPYYTKKICLIGTESCGKTTLVRNLAKYFNTTHVEEAGRYICDDAGGIDNMQPYHYFEILFKHKQLEKEALKNANKVLLIDTDSLITLYYYQLGFENTNEINSAFENIAKGISVLNNYDLYIFLEPDVRWVQDGTRTYGDEEVRKQNNEKLKAIFDENNINYICINGTYQERYEKSKKEIEKVLCKGR